MSRSNSKGAFERARQRWIFAVVYVCRRMGRGATGAFQAAILLVEYTNRALFLRDADLVAFPALDLLTLRAGVNEKTMRRAIDKLEEAGLVRTQQRHNDSNLYFLTIPPDAETHLSDCEATITKRRRARRHWRSQVSVRGGQMGTKPLPSVQLHSDLNSDVNSISKSGDLASPHTLEDQKEKRVGEEEREGLAEIYYLARKHYGERGASVAAKALNAGRSASEVMEIMAEEIEAGAVGDADYLGSALLYGEWSRW